MSHLLLDLRSAWRAWMRRPGLPLAVIVTLGLGLGGATGMFAIADATLWKPLDVPSPERLVWVSTVERGEPGQTSPGAAATWMAQASSLKAIAAAWPRAAVVQDSSGTDRVDGAFVSPAIFATTSVRPALGRVFTEADAQAGAEPVMVISHASWQSRFAGAADIAGRRVTFNGTPRVIVGVLPAAAAPLLGTREWWAPLALDADQQGNFGPRYLEVIASLAPGATAETTRAELTALVAGRAKANDGSPLDVSIVPLVDHLTREYRDGLLLLLATVGMLVGIACVNVANLLLAQAWRRYPELAVRASLGADRGRLVRQLVLETFVLVAAAGASSLLVAQWVVAGLKVLLPSTLPRLADASVDATAAWFTLSVVVLVTAVCGIVPAWRASTVDVLTALSSVSRTVGHADDRVRRAFVVAQVTLSVVLAIAGGLLLRSANALSNAPRGYDAANVLTASLSVPGAYGTGAAIASLTDRVRTSLVELPGVTHVAVASRVPLSGGAPSSDLALVEEPFTEGVDREVRIRLVSPGYFAASGTPLRAGRDISAQDEAGGAPVVVVNETLARRLAGDGGIVGRAVKFAVRDFNGAAGTRAWQIVGVVGDTFDAGPRAAVAPEVFVPIAQTPAGVFYWINRQVSLAVKASGAPPAAREVRATLATVDAALAVSDVRTLEQRLADHFVNDRLLSRLTGAMGLAGLLLSALGIFSVISQVVARRERDLAIRLALGAMPGGVIGSVIGQSLVLAGTGAALGLALGMGLGGLLRSTLFGVSAVDPVTLAGVTFLLLGLAAVAAWIPARRIAGIDPAVTLRSL